MLDPTTFTPVLSYFVGRGLISGVEAGLVSSMFTPEFAFADALAIAETIHVQVKVDDVDALPHQDIMAQDVDAQRSTPGFRKYSFAGGLGVIFTSGPIAEEDLIPAR